jgi:phage gp46-like protein
MTRLDSEAHARRRQVGRTILGLTRALGRTLWLWDRSKDDPSVASEARAACDDAIAELRRSLAAVEDLRRSFVLVEDGRPSVAA